MGRRIVMLSDEINKVVIDKERLHQIMQNIIYLERENIKTRKLTTQDMIKTIRRIIEKNIG